MYKVWRRGGGGAVLANKPPKHQFSTSLWQYCPLWTNLRDWEVGAAALANQPPKPPFLLVYVIIVGCVQSWENGGLLPLLISPPNSSR